MECVEMSYGAFKPHQISSVIEVITNSMVNMILPKELFNECVIFLQYNKAFNKCDKEVEQMLINKVNKALVETF